jgi:hypothetical protein
MREGVEELRMHLGWQLLRLLGAQVDAAREVLERLGRELLESAFHEYAIEYGPGSVRFLVDGAELQRFTSGVTRSSMYLHVNAWFPSWLAGTRPANDAFTSVDWVEYVGR